ncbi:MAG: hypothetical protein QM788_16710 [Roseateles sp.]|uniref:hypothetical protein n=1 Tax=Roseateles sp. TaxID=1971397 RepID=UPI0039EABA7C
MILLQVEQAQSRGVRPEGQAPARAAAGQGAPVGGGRVDATALQRLPARLRTLRAGQRDALPRAKVLRLFVEAALLDELGSALQLDPAFGDMVERTCRAIEQDEGGARLLADALAELQALAS